MAKKVIKGKKVMVFVKDASGKYVSIALATNHTLTMSASTVDLAVKTKDDATGQSFADSEIDVISWNISSEHLAGTNEGKGWADVADLFLKGEKVELVFDGVIENGVPTGGFTPSAAASGEGADEFQGYKGQALITSLTLNAPLEDNASYTVEFTGCGALSKFNAA